MPFKELLVPIDFSASSVRALRMAVQLCRRGQGRITLLHVGLAPGMGQFDLGAYGVPIPDALVRIHEQAAIEQRHAIEKLAHEEVPEDVPWRAVVREGFPPDEILAEAKTGACDLLVMGTHGRSGLERVVLGSVTERVLRRAELPVLVTR